MTTYKLKHHGGGLAVAALEVIRVATEGLTWQVEKNNDADEVLRDLDVAGEILLLVQNLSMLAAGTIGMVLHPEHFQGAKHASE